MAVNFQPIYILASGGERALEQLDTTTNNLANVNTPGFKKLLLKEMSQKIPDNQGQSKELFVFPRFEKTPVVIAQGSLKKTDRPLDLAIDGEGFFQVRFQNQIFLTRNGHFKLDSTGILVDVNSNPVLDTQGKVIKLNSTENVTITKDGSIYQNNELVAKLSIVNYQSVKPIGESYYAPSSSQTNASYEIHQGFLENSNVNPIKAMTELINAQRRMEMYGNLMKALDSVEQKSIEIGRA
ncbi:flagellar hook basal-body protein [Hydrogenivirga sp. 128-5-R1-1]|uniref:flagellar hook-basal body protein n=1 Tax=Hydrogenivirga sp. 128-5-R1-1 TaxID=392423 RepID=UPI00015F2AF5|nr:flagellar hook basal-body protein [Hydrogenivirga sp. 128-5-R1-1]EDP74019.1 flagellar hook basal-body protein FlgG [Hydrogenivirga sp. 128-5-R1-1]